MVTLATRLASAFRRAPRAPRRLVTRFALRDPFQVWRGIQAIDNIVSAHRAAGDTFVTVRLEFEQRKDGDE